MPRNFTVGTDHLDASSAWATAPAFTVGCWVNVVVSQAAKFISLSVGTDSNNAYVLGQRADAATGQAAASSFHGGTNSQNVSLAGLTASTWQWASGTWSGASPSITEVARIAGGNKGQGGGVTAPTGTVSHVCIGARTGGGAQPAAGGMAHACFLPRAFTDLEDAYMGAGGNPRALGATHYYAINTASGTESDRIGSTDLTITGTTAFAGAGPKVATWWTAAALANQSLTQGTPVPSIDLTTKVEDVQAAYTASLLQIGPAGTATTAVGAGAASRVLTLNATTGIVAGTYVAIAGGAKTLVVYVSGNAVVLAAALTWNNADSVVPFPVITPTALTANGVTVSANTFGGGTPGAAAVGSFAGCVLRFATTGNAAAFADSPPFAITVASSNTTPSFSAGPTLTSANTDGFTYGATSTQTATAYLVTMLAGSAAPSQAQMLSGTPAGFVQRVTFAATAAAAFGITSTGLTNPLYDEYLMLASGAGNSAVTAFASQLKAPPAGKQYTPLIVSTVAGITRANPASVHAVAHGRATGDWVQIWGIAAGMVEINLAFSPIVVVDADNFTLTNIDSSLYTPYVSGGIYNWGQSYLAGSSPLPATGDIGICDLTDPQGAPCTLRPDGVIVFSTASNLRQNVTVDFYSVSAQALAGLGSGYINDQAPIAANSTGVLPGIFIPLNIGFTGNLANLLGITDPQGDTLLGTALTAVPAGFTVSAGALSGSASTNSLTPVTFRFPNNSTEFTDVLCNLVLGDLAVPNGVGQSLNSAQSLATGSYFANTTPLLADDPNPLATAPAGQVIAQFPAANTLAPPGTVITFTLSTGNAATTPITPPSTTPPPPPVPPIQNPGQIVARVGGGAQFALNDLYHYWGADLSLSNSQDVLTISGTVMGQQRVLRRLLTNPGDYLFQPDYGAGLPQQIGQTADIPKITALIRSQILLEAVVAKDPAPVITVTNAADSTDASAIAITIAYTDAPSGLPQTLSFSLSQTLH